MGSSLMTAGHTTQTHGPTPQLGSDMPRRRLNIAGAVRSLTPLVRTLSVAARGDVLGSAFQGRAAVRRITQADHLVLAAYARSLPLEARATAWCTKRLLVLERRVA